MDTQSFWVPASTWRGVVSDMTGEESNPDDLVPSLILPQEKKKRKEP